MFILLVKTTMYITHVFLPLVSLLVHALLVALYAVSIHGQAGPDMSDPQYPQPGAPWYITQSCSVARTGAVRGFCQQAKGAFAVAIVMWSVPLSLLLLLALLLSDPPSPRPRPNPNSIQSSNPPCSAIFALHIPLAIYSLIPARTQRHARTTSLESSSMEPDNRDPKDMSPQSLMSYRQKEWEMGTLPRTPGTAGGMKSPMTPRTVAFNTLGGDLPLRQAYPADRKG